MKPKIGCIRQEAFFKAENTVLLLAARLGILDAEAYRAQGSGFALKSEISLIEIDSLRLLLLPCEIFPELVYGGYLNSEQSATGMGAEINPPPLSEIIGENAVIIGLANDELGYVIPPNDFFLHPKTPYFENARDVHGRKHYEETNSLGPQTAEAIFKTVCQIVNSVEKTKI